MSKEELMPDYEYVIEEENEEEKNQGAGSKY
jgi:hypothetical protein